MLHKPYFLASEMVTDPLRQQPRSPADSCVLGTVVSFIAAAEASHPGARLTELEFELSAAFQLQTHLL